MNQFLLSDFVRDVSAKQRMTFADVRRLDRDILPAGISTREEAEVLIELDRTVGKVDPTWADYLVGAIVDFVVWGSRPTGYVDAEMAQWLTAVLYRGSSARTALRIARAIEQEAHEVAPELLSMGAHLFARRRPETGVAGIAG